MFVSIGFAVTLLISRYIVKVESVWNSDGKAYEDNSCVKVLEFNSTVRTCGQITNDYEKCEKYGDWGVFETETDCCKRFEEGCTSCNPGYYGSSCDECDCNGSGTCDDGIAGTGSCTCDSGFTGTNCDQCDEGFYGSDCTVCPSQSCLNGGTQICDDGKIGTGQLSCDCDAASNWIYGDYCEFCKTDYNDNDDTDISGAYHTGSHIATDGSPSKNDWGTTDPNPDFTPTCMDASQRAAVQCCKRSQCVENHGQECWRKTTNSDCASDVTWAEAVAHCDAVGMQICSLSETDNDECVSKGCNFDFFLVWTRDSCDP